MNRIIEKLKKDTLVKGFSVLTAGTAITQIVTIFLAPILTRLYTPAQYGINSIFISSLTILGVIATFRFQIAIIVSKDEGDKKALTVICFITTTAISILMYILSAVFEKEIIHALKIESATWLRILPISVFFYGIYETLYQVLLSKSKYRHIVNISILKVVAQGIFQITFSFMGIGYMGLIYGNLISYIIPVAILAFTPTVSKLLKKVDLKEVVRVIKEYSEFPRFAFPAEIISITIYSIIPYLLTFLFSTEITGYFSLANRFIGIPITLFGNSLRQAYFREAAEEYATKKSVRKSFVKTTKILIIFVIPLSAVIWFFSPWFFNIFFGSEWMISGEFAKALLIYFIARFLVVPITSTVNIVGKQRLGLLINLLIILSLFGGTYLYSKSELNDPLQFLVLFSVVIAIIYFFYYYLILKLVIKVPIPNYKIILTQEN